MRDFGAWFCIHRASNGLTKDADFDLNWPAMKSVLPRSSYHYYNNLYEPKAQARAYWNVIKVDPEGICWLDVEDRNGGPYWGWKHWYDFIEELKAISGLPYERIGIYTAYYYWRESTTGATTAQLAYFAKFPLWLAWYGLRGSDPLNPNYALCMVPPPWITPLILQSGTPAIGHAAGVESEEIDYNQFNGGAVEFARYFNVIPTLPPATGGGMYQGKTNTDAKIWSSIGGTQIGTVKAGETVTGSAPLASGYTLLNTPIRGYTKTLWLTGYAEVPVTPPPPPPPAVVKVPFDFVVEGFKPYHGELEKA